MIAYLFNKYPLLVLLSALKQFNIKIECSEILDYLLKL
ncbi:hypothetical protein M087_2446 [Bacteroides fragilis str. S23 R14]|uniref:Uncharacterized protein n=1 Tax=Bacteroides fragilis TaxID=817 RepID=A0A853PTJ2_BACFG|nr:hypothetical protein M087_2446 [Bacteroides fragilis str. S23 R14]EYA38643.1 hypothetical protein M075_2822 [Bacteroides fragilis str. 20793-3]EYA66108.1 hypothetical protein M139_2620 [Bacteroides fragilis str. S23L24]EYE44381.1 hypothetical protein M138_2504 [Bacteroides fragilis str. S23L17]OCR31811.1 hypothetical protein AC094_25830 [Bacteroides fragilis]